MTEPTSHIAPTRDSHVDGRRWRLQLSLIFGAAFLVALLLFAQHIANSRLGRTIDAPLGQLADPASWTP